MKNPFYEYLPCMVNTVLTWYDYVLRHSGTRTNRETDRNEFTGLLAITSTLKDAIFTMY